MCEHGAAASPPPRAAAEGGARESSPERARSGGLSAGVVCPAQLSDGERTYRRGPWLGRGGFAAVWACTDTQARVTGDTDRFALALKVVNKSSLDAGARKKLVAEIELHTPLRHPRVVRFFGAFEDDANVYLLLQQWGCGASLAHAVAARGCLGEAEAAAHTAALLDALAHLHARGIAHRDIKPANCLLRSQAPAQALPRGAASDVALADFGLAARCGVGAPARRGLCGTPNYLAPEALAAGAEARHGREADVWALGCLAHTLLVGHPPFTAATVPATYARIKAGDLRMPPHLSPAAQDFLRCALRMEPKERPRAAALLQHPFVRHFAAMPLPAHIVAIAAPGTPLAAGGPGSARGSPARGSPARAAGGSPASRGSPGGFGALSIGSPGRGRDARSRLGAPPPMQLAAAASPATPAPPARSALSEALPRAARVAQLTPGTPLTPLDAASPASPPPACAAAGPGATSWADTPRVVRHADCAERYGLGYELSDGAVGALFLDGSRMLAPAGSGRALYCPRRARRDAALRADAGGAFSPASPASPAASPAASELSKKADILRFMASQLGAACSVADASCCTVVAEPPAAPHVVAWARSAHAVAFRLSSRAVQLRFTKDGSQLLLSPDGATVWFDRADGSLPTQHRLEGLPAQQSADTPLMRRLHFARKMLLRLAATGSAPDGAAGDAGAEDALEL